jgi:hypothetical protein
MLALLLNNYRLRESDSLNFCETKIDSAIMIRNLENLETWLKKPQPRNDDLEMGTLERF